MMTRTSFKKLWMAVVAALLVSSFYVYTKAEQVQADISRTSTKVERLERDLRAGNQLSAALAELDNVTIDESKATRLDILRHLGLEKSDLEFKTLSKAERKIGQTRLYVRAFSLKGEMPYKKALDQVDWLHNTKKVVITDITLEPGRGYGDVVRLKVEGKLYGLDKDNK